MLTFQDILSAVRTLNAKEQFQLASKILEEIPTEQWPPPNAEWVAESERRSAEFEAGRMSAAIWPEVQARARKRAELDV